jgi:hypothetical protein
MPPFSIFKVLPIETAGANGQSLMSPRIYGLAFLAASIALPVAAQADLLSHRAIYDIALVPEKAKGVVGASGRIAFEFTGSACEGYALNFRQVTTLDDGEGRQKLLDMRSTTWEDAEGRKFRFNVKNMINNQTSQQSDGTAERGKDGGVSVALKSPKPTRVDLAGEPVFPTDHTRRLLDAARTGTRVLNLPLYDGSDGGQKFYDTTAIIGKMIEGAASDRLETPAREAGLAAEKRWPVSVSYFETGQTGDRTPAYVMSFDLLENGVYSNIRFDFGDFALSAKMSGLQVIKSEACKK